MADFQVCFNWLMDSEDRELKYAQVPDACPKGCAGPCFAISGINSGAFPLQFAKIAALPPAERGDEVESFYQAAFWNPYVAQIASDDVAKRWLDAAVNMGEGTATKLMQKAVNDTFPGSAHLAEDGQLGPDTVNWTNSCGEQAVVAAFINQRVAHYQAIAAANPAKAKYLDGWLARARR